MTSVKLREQKKKKTVKEKHLSTESLNIIEN